jgi:flagellar biosynthesis GTPase FlhF
MRYDDAVASLFQGPLELFVAERKRLAGELKAAGEPEAAAKLAKLTRPPLSAWVVDQLWWHARAAFEAMFETAQRLRDGKLEATAAHRDAIAKLRAEAAKILTGAEHGATEAMRRVTQTLAALAAAGGWDPDPPGALSADRDPPGFEAIGISNVVELPATPAGKRDATAEPTPAGAHDDVHSPHDDIRAARERRTAEAAEAAHERRDAAEAARRRDLEAAAARAQAAAELRRAEAERAKAAAERQRLEAALRTARGDIAQREREVEKLERDLVQARSMVAQARAVVEGLEERLAQLDK